MSHELLYNQAKQWVKEAGEKIRNYLREGDIRFEAKSRLNDLVTDMDRGVERFLVEKIKAYDPDHLVYGEEGIVQKPDHFNGYVWLIDPIDGTSNFVSQQCDFVISVGLYLDGQGVLAIIYDVTRGEMIHALRGKGVYCNEQKCKPLSGDLALIDSLVSLECIFHDPSWEENGWHLMELGRQARGIRIYGASALALAKVATGKHGAFLTTGTNAWDYGAGKILVEEAGGIVTDFHGMELPLGKRSSVIASHPALHNELLNWVNK
jgi:myo-inositol-1(or 4)-monophosphatase